MWNYDGAMMLLVRIMGVETRKGLLQAAEEGVD